MAETTKTNRAEQARIGKAAKLLAFNTWRQEWRAENPDGSKSERKVAWDAVRSSEVRKARRALKQMQEKGGLKIVPASA